ncbi:hypothetical protein [Shewanella aestuarii]|uniref:Uncharacterized protein n=1 Tax=Shewanella aestuarii TaxID=1028752 RepID=A0A6G9QHM8_9GAMM|nr:hypothetical protein [Shewanella aestuarii]QIR13575.1 hypothetical protein HBH39_02835 [Shewanella aestuarii]
MNYLLHSQFNDALYLPAMQVGYANYANKTYLEKLPKPLSVSDFNIFNEKSNMVHHPYALYSAGLINNLRNPKSCLVTNPVNFNRSLILGDSAGYQVGKGLLKITDQVISDIFYFLSNYCHFAMTLDVPMFACRETKLVDYPTPNSCLNATLYNLDRFLELQEDNFPFLNIIQGWNKSDSDYWYHKVKKYPFFGYAINCENLKVWDLIWRLLLLIRDGYFEKKASWFHLLGLGNLKAAAIVNITFQLVKGMVSPCVFNMSYDSSTPFLMAGRYMRYNKNPVISNNRLALPLSRVDESWLGNNEPFPEGYSYIGRHVNKSDVFNTTSKNYRNLSHLLLVNHNLETQVKAISEVNKLILKPNTESGLPSWLLRVKDALIYVFEPFNVEKCITRLNEPRVKLALNKYLK